VLAHLHTHAPAPAVYLKVVLMREFGWTPADVDRIPLTHILDIMTCMRAETEYHKRPKGKKVNAA
jgi:hypothetical protein